jgi:hypothetical protein
MFQGLNTNSLTDGKYIDGRISYWSAVVEGVMKVLRQFHQWIIVRGYATPKGKIGNDPRGKSALRQ